jgi:hypothetical protein
MSKKHVIGLVLLIAAAAFGLTSCGFVSLAGTNWRAQALETGAGFHFITGSTGDWEVGALGTWVDLGTGFTYTYSFVTKTGLIDGTTEFSVDGEVLTSDSVTYTYDSTP